MNKVVIWFTQPFFKVFVLSEENSSLILSKHIHLIFDKSHQTMYIQDRNREEVCPYHEVIFCDSFQFVIHPLFPSPSPPKKIQHHTLYNLRFLFPFYRLGSSFIIKGLLYNFFCFSCLYALLNLQKTHLYIDAPYIMAHDLEWWQYTQLKEQIQELTHSSQEPYDHRRNFHVQPTNHHHDDGMASRRKPV